MLDELKNKVFKIDSESSFNQVALAIFKWQSSMNKTYVDYLRFLRVNPNTIQHYTDIPFLPIQFFKSKKITTGEFNPETLFTSSGTTGNQTSIHYVKDLAIYQSSFTQGFERFYGSIKEYCFLALLPNYLERTGSSLVYMADIFVTKTKQNGSGFYLYEHAELYNKLEELKSKGQKTCLIGVSFALLDFIESYSIDWPELIVMETGGMKGRKKEITRTDLHYLLKKGFGVSAIHSEYGMTELLSQAYAKKDGYFSAPPWMKFLLRDTTDPLSYIKHGKTGGINVIDLANIHSCSFIATDDLGKQLANDSIEVLGRFDNSDVRGCNLML